MNPPVARRQFRRCSLFRTFILWCVLFVLCWPLALAALVLYPLVWLIALPFRLLGVATDVLFKTLRGILLLPWRLLERARPSRRALPSAA